MIPRTTLLTWRAGELAFAALVTAALATSATAEPVLMVSGVTAIDAEVDRAMPLPDQTLLDTERLATAARLASARFGETVLWFPESGRLVILENEPPDFAEPYSCLPPDGEAYDPATAPRFKAAPSAVDPLLWTAMQQGRALWWPEVPPRSVCSKGLLGLHAVPSVVDFKNVEVGEAPVRALELRNEGATTTIINATDISGVGFTITNDGCTSVKIFVGATCQYEVRFAPGSVGDFTGLVEVTHDASPDPLEVPLRGSGVPVPIAIFSDGFESAP